MTDEERAEDYYKKSRFTKCIDKYGQFTMLEPSFHYLFKKVYLDGLAEGRKEEQEKTCYCEHIQNFEKENAELKAQIPQWHDLRKDPNDLPKCTENEQIIFFVKEYYKSIEKYINHFCLGFYKKSFMDNDVKLFVEKSKGYECEHSIEDVIRWCELPQFKE